MSQFSPKGEKQLTNTNRALDVLSQLAPDADPAVLIAAADELSKISDAITAVKDLGLVVELVGMVALNTGEVFTIRQSNEIGGVNNG